MRQGPTVANVKSVHPASGPLNPISNAPQLEVPDDFPDKYKFELTRLRNRVKNLEADLKDKDGRLLKALGMLDDELMFWRTFLNLHVGESLGQINNRVNRIVGTIDYLKDRQPHVFPALELPERWKQKK